MPRETSILEAMKKSKSESSKSEPESKVTTTLLMKDNNYHHHENSAAAAAAAVALSKASPKLTPKLTPTSAKSSREQAYSILMDEDAADGFHAHLVVPDVLDKAPSEKLPITFGDCNSIVMGNLLVPEELRYKPVIDLSRCDPKKFYTLIFTDPDCPNRSMPAEREHLHWLVVNITDNNVSKGEEIAPYKPPLPNLGSGLHRYVFILLEQTRPIIIATEAEKAAMAKAREAEAAAVIAAAAAVATKNNRLHRYVFILLEQTRPIIIATEAEKAAMAKAREAEAAAIMAAAAAVATKNNRVTSAINKAHQKGQTNSLPTTGKNSPAASDKSSINPLIPVQLKRNSFDDNENLLVDRIQFSTKGFMKKYAIIGVVAANFFQTEYNEYVGKQLEAQRQDHSIEKKKEIVKEISKIDEKKTLESLKSLKVGKI
uniref:Phosphatidylethanolamine-binding protein n=1 Tax=Panagrolaimus sp. ES5 TaxID=591445 RepID=A0AC34FPC7_9BILA